MAKHQCGHCKQFGHNKRTCPSLRKDTTSTNSVDVPRESAWHSSFIRHPKKTRKPPTCSCCGRKGHTKRTCPKELTDTQGKVIQPGTIVIRDYCEIMLFTRSYVSSWGELYGEFVSMEYPYMYRCTHDEKRFERAKERVGKTSTYSCRSHSFENGGDPAALQRLYDWCWEKVKNPK